MDYFFSRSWRQITKKVTVHYGTLNSVASTYYECWISRDIYFDGSGNIDLTLTTVSGTPTPTPTATATFTPSPTARAAATAGDGYCNSNGYCNSDSHGCIHAYPDSYSNGNGDTTASLTAARVKYWQIIADNLSAFGWSWGCQF